MDGAAVGSHPTVSRLLKGVYNLRPPQPRYAFTWDVQIVLDMLRSWPPAAELSDKQLTLRLTMILALAGAHRCGELRMLSHHLCQTSDGSIRLSLLRPRKTQRSGEPLQQVCFAPFPVPELCPVQHLLAYIARSASWRTADNASPSLLVSFRKPHKPVSSPTVARWLKDVLSQAGISTSDFSAHSTRGASASAAARAGVSTTVIMDTADWKRASTFHRFYRRDVAPASAAAATYSAAVLSSGD